jgi:hypothetical protein
MIKDHGRRALSRLYEVEGGSHFEGQYSQFPNLLRPMLPCFQDAFGALEDWTIDGDRPPASHLVTRNASIDLVNTCTL